MCLFILFTGSFHRLALPAETGSWALEFSEVRNLGGWAWPGWALPLVGFPPDLAQLSLSWRLGGDVSQSGPVSLPLPRAATAPDSWRQSRKRLQNKVPSPNKMPLPSSERARDGQVTNLVPPQMTSPKQPRWEAQDSSLGPLFLVALWPLALAPARVSQLGRAVQPMGGTELTNRYQGAWLPAATHH